MNVRPTSDKVREAVFDILADRVEDARILDLYAGTGALGLEALSRGGRFCVFVDSHPRSLATIVRNIGELGLADRTAVFKVDLTRGPGRLAQERTPFDIIFLDPPYGRDLVTPALKLIVRLSLASPESIAVVEQSSREAPLPEGAPWSLVKERTYGQTRVSFLTPIAY